MDDFQFKAEAAEPPKACWSDEVDEDELFAAVRQYEGGEDDETEPISLPKQSSALNWGKLWSVAVLLIGCCLGYLVHPMMQLKTSANVSGNAVTAQPSSVGTVVPTIVVDVKGDVHHPGVYHLTSDARVQDAIQAAGGLIHPGDAALLNMAAPVDDGAEVDVQAAGSASTAGENSTPGNATVAPATNRLDINQADSTSLQTIPGIRQVKAAAIVTYRQQHGRFKQITDLLQVPGIGNATLARIQPYVTIGS